MMTTLSTSKQEEPPAQAGGSFLPERKGMVLGIAGTGTEPDLKRFCACAIIYRHIKEEQACFRDFRRRRSIF